MRLREIHCHVGLCLAFVLQSTVAHSHTIQTNEDRLLLKKKKMIGVGTLTSSSTSSTKFILDDSPTWIFRSGGAGAEIFPCGVPRKTFHLKFLRLDSSVHSKILKPMIPLRASSSEVIIAPSRLSLQSLFFFFSK